MKMNSTLPRNLKVIAINDSNKHGFDIYLDFSGRMEYLVHHRHCGILYNILKSGVRVDTLLRVKPHDIDEKTWGPREYRQNRGAIVDSMISHLIRTIDCYIAERNEFGAAAYTCLSAYSAQEVA